MSEIPAEWHTAKQFAETLLEKIRETDWALEKAAKDAPEPPWLDEWLEKMSVAGPTAETMLVIVMTMVEKRTSSEDRQRVGRWNYLAAKKSRFTDCMWLMHNESEVDKPAWYAKTEKIRSFVKAA